MNRLIGVVGMALSGAALVTVICVTALLLDGVTVLFRFGSLVARGEVPAVLVGLTLAFPAVCALAGRARAGGTRAGFVRGTLALAAGSALVLALVSHVSFLGVIGRSPLLAALFLAVAAAWCPLVLEYAITALPRPFGAPVAGLPHMAAQRSIMGEEPDAHAALPEDTEVPDAAEARE